MKYLYLFTLIAFCSFSLQSQNDNLTTQGYQFLTSIDNSSVIESIQENPIRTFTIDFGQSFIRKVTVDFNRASGELINSYLVRFEDPMARAIIEESLKDPMSVNYIKQMDYLNEDGSLSTSFVYNTMGLSQYITIDEKGNKTIRIFESGNATEIFQTTNRNGKVTEENEFNGYSKTYYKTNVFTTRKSESTGQIAAEGERINGLKTGTWKFYHPNEQFQSECTYSEGLTSDYCNVYFDNGELFIKVDAKSGDKATSTFYFPSGKTNATFEMVNHVNNGASVIYLENGNKEAEGHYKNGFKNGVWKFYSDDGALAVEIEHAMDKYHGTLKYYSPDGKVLDTEEYLYGYRVK